MTAFIKRNRKVVVILFFVVCGLFLFWKAHQGYIFNDEPFMVTLGHRLLRGDRFFIDEWNTCQMTGLFFVPFVFLFTKITGGIEGLILCCRIVYVVWWLFAGIIIYRRLKQYGRVSIIAVTMFLLYTPLDEMTLTYNAMGLSLLLLFVTYFLTEGNVVLDYLNGIVLAFAVLAYPGLLAIYLVYFVAVVIKNVFRIKTDANVARMLSWKLFLRITVSSAFVAVLFCLFVFSAGFSNVFESLSAMFSVGADNKKGILLLLEKLYEKMPVMMIGGPLCIVASLIDRNRRKRASLYMIVQILVFAVTVVYVLIDIYSFNAVMIPMFFVGLQAFVLVKNRDSMMNICFGVVGLIAAFVWYFSSDTKIPSFSNGFVLINIASVIYLYQLYTESEAGIHKPVLNKTLAIALACAICVQVGAEFYIKVRRSYWDELFPALRTTIQTGAARNITTCDYFANSYNDVYEDVQEMRRLTDEDETKMFLSLSLFPSIYLDMNYQYGTFSSWTYTGNALGFEALDLKLTKYYELNLDKVADIIYVSSADRGEINKITCIDFTQYDETILKAGSVFIRS